MTARARALVRRAWCRRAADEQPVRRPSAVLAALHDLQFEDFYVGGAPTSTPAREVLVRRANGTTYTLVCAADRDLDELLMPGDVVAVDAVHEGR